jgi:hypothetical protein
MQIQKKLVILHIVNGQVCNMKKACLFVLIFVLIFNSACKKEQTKVEQNEVAKLDTIFPQDGKITFAGLQWKVIEKTEAESLNDLFYSSSSNNVFVDKDGRLHLLITKQNDTWMGAYIESSDSFAFGSFFIDLETKVNEIDQNSFVQFSVKREGRNIQGMTEAGINIYGKPIYLEKQYIEYYLYTTEHKFALLKNPVIEENYYKENLKHSIQISADAIGYSTQLDNRNIYWHTVQKGKKVKSENEDEIVYSKTGIPLKIAVGYFLDSFADSPKKDLAEIIIKDIRFNATSTNLAKAR